MARAGWGAFFAILIVATASCSSTPSVRPAPSSDISDARPIARQIGDILLSFAAYDYAVVGGLNGDHVRSITADRYAAVARAQAELIADNATNIISAVVDTAGPIHDRLVVLADTLSELRKDALAYADSQSVSALARILTDVDRSWGLLHDLESLLKDDGTLDRTIERGLSMKTSAAPARGALVSIGPYAGAAEAAEQAQALGPNAVPATTSPFVVRMTYADRPSADAAATTLRKAGTTAIVIDQTTYAFSRTGPSPDAELWREPERFIDTRAGARKVAISSDAGYIATGGDDGFIALFTNDGVLRALPRFNAGVNQLEFTDDARYLFGGGQVLETWILPHPNANVGEPIRLQGAAISAVYVPRANAFAASSVGVIGGRAPDGAPLADPFPIDTSGAVTILSASDTGELFMGVQVPQGFEVRVLRVGQERFPRGILRVPGTGRAFAVDPTGSFGAAVTDQGTYRFSLKAADPTKSIQRVGGTVRDVEFGGDSTLYLLDAKAITAVSAEGTVRWTQPLVDGRRIAVGIRPVVLDGTDVLITFAPQDGTQDRLAPVGQIQDLVVSRDGKWVGVIADARRAVLFRLQ
jgi:hypothetical protein